jgi:DNA invertase Pin-like site-specific DNA recombinase
MKTNKNKLSANKQLQENIALIFAKYYSQTLSESIKRGLKARKKRLSISKVAL